MSASRAERTVAAEDIELIEAALLANSNVERIIRMKVIRTSPDELVVAAKIGVDPGLSMHQLSAVLHLANRRVGKAVPQAQHIYIEPDVYLDPDISAPSTSSIVMLSSD
ncbi:cation transporter dimerization domain-containing protein [Leucobacter sp. GX24907]